MCFKYPLRRKPLGVQSCQYSIDFQLKKDEIHVWLANLRISPLLVNKLIKILSLEEQEKVSRIHIKQDKARYIVCHGVLRKILGHYLGKSPEHLDFECAGYRKPVLGDEFKDQNIQFNLSRTEDMALYAIARGHEVGVDIEKIRNIGEMNLIVQYYFSRREKEKFFKLNKDQKTATFFRCWTLKEACLKASGTGLSGPLEKFEVSIYPAEPAGLLSINDNPKEASQWSVF